MPKHLIEEQLIWDNVLWGGKFPPKSQMNKRKKENFWWFYDIKTILKVNLEVSIISVQDLSKSK